MNNSKLLEQLIQSLSVLPGVGPRSAQRMAYVLLQKKRIKGLELADVLKKALTEIGHCEDCKTFTENKKCLICEDISRIESGLLCIVESPSDIAAIESTGQFNGRYFVLFGHLSPIDGIGPSELGLTQLKQRLAQEKIHEVILATNPNIEGEATANYIAQVCQQFYIPASRIAHGVPVGGELEMVDGTTLSHSLIGRQRIEF